MGRKTALAALVVVSLVAGTPYLYGTYAPQLMARVGRSASDAATLSLAVSVGGGIGGLPGGLLIDRFGPGRVITLASTCILVGYFCMYKVYTLAWRSLLVMCLAMAFVGFGLVTSFFGGLKAAQVNFPNHRGVASALPVSAFGLSATLFSVVAAAGFRDEPGRLLRFLAFFCGSVAFSGSWFVKVYPHEPQGAAAEGLLQDPVALDDPSALVEILESRKESTWEAVESLVTSREFLTHYGIVALCSGIGQAYIYGVGFVVKSHSPQFSGPEAVAAAQAVQVSTISLANFGGRLVAGVVSDHIHKTWLLLRVWVVAGTIVVNLSGQVLLVATDRLALITLASAVIGCGYGLLNAAYPAVIADSFGTHKFSTAWGIICSGPLLVFFSLQRLLGAAYDSRSHDGVCALGRECYSVAFKTGTVLCVVALVATALHIRHQ